jgi:hypothetical protein
MRMLNEILRELQTDASDKVRIVSGAYTVGRTLAIARANAERTHGHIAATTVVEADAQRGIIAGVTMLVSRDEAELLFRDGAVDEFGLQGPRGFRVLVEVLPREGFSLSLQRRAESQLGMGLAATTVYDDDLTYEEALASATRVTAQHDLLRAKVALRGEPPIPCAWFVAGGSVDRY